MSSPAWRRRRGKVRVRLSRRQPRWRLYFSTDDTGGIAIGYGGGGGVMARRVRGEA